MSHPAPAPTSDAPPRSVVARAASRAASVARHAHWPGRKKPDGSAPPPTYRRVRTPTVLQLEAVECGAAALAIVLAYHGRIVPLEELRVACGVSRDGSKASNVLKAARTLGMTAKGFKKEPADLRAMPVPMIVHWNFNHFLVVEGFVGDRVYLNDPAGGPLVVSAEEFDQSFTGVVMTFEKTDAFTRGGERPSTIRALQERLPGVGMALAFVVLAGLALVIPGIVAPVYSRVFVDDVLVKGMSEWIKPLLWLMLGTAAVNAGLTILQQRYLLRLETRLSVHSSAKFLWHVLFLPVEFFTQRYAGEIGSRVGLNDRIAKLVSGDLATTLLNVTVIVFYGILLLQYDVMLTFVGVGAACLNIAALRFVSRRRADLSQKMLQDRGKLGAAAMGGLQTIETLKATGAESDFFARWSGYQAKVGNAYQQLQLQTMLLSAVPPLLMALNTALILGLGGLRVMDGLLSMGMLIAFQSLMGMFTTPVNKLVELGGTMQEVGGDLNRLNDVLGAKRDVPSTLVASDDEPVKLSGHLELRDVTFGYSRLEAPLLDRFSLTLRPGARVALVGGSGCGKSTIARLVAGLYEPWSGDVLFDARTRHDTPREVMTNSFAVVDQDICLFEGNVRDNITLWNDTIPERDIVQAAKDACIHEDVTARTGGYVSAVAEGGRNFSGGQRQRLEIARALVGNPSVVILDEATSALDPTTEQEIDDNLRRRGCTCLIVAHRLSTIRDCDEIIVLERGKVVQRGTHEQLAAIPGLYQNLVAAE